MPKLVAGGGLSTTYVAEIPVKLQIADVECDTPEQDFDGKDNAWSQVACYGMLSFFTLGVQYAQGILFVEWLNDFDVTRADAASVTTLSTGVMEGVGALTGWIIMRYGERCTCLVGGVLATAGLLLGSFAQELWQLHLTYGVMVGCGHSLSLFAGVVLMNRWFDTRKALASGLGNSGAGVGTLVFGLLIPVLIASAGWRVTMRVLAGGTAVSLCGVAFLLSPPRGTHQQQNVDEEGHSTEGGVSLWMDLCTNQRLVFSILATFVMGFPLWVPGTYVVKHALDQGHTEAEANRLIVFVGLGSLCLRVPMMIVADMVGPRVAATLLLVTFGTITLFMPFTESYCMLCLFAVMCGGCVGSLMSVTSPLVAEVVSMRVMPVAVTVTYSSLCGGIISGSALAGLLFDATGSMKAPFICCGCLFLIAAGIHHIPILLPEGEHATGR